MTEAACCRQLSHARRKARAGSAADIPSAAWHEKAAAAADSLIVAFTTAPQTVLGICEQTLKKARENDATKGAMLFLSDVLAMPSQHSMAHAGSVAADVLLGRPELREWMVARVETLKRGAHPPWLINTQHRNTEDQLGTTACMFLLGALGALHVICAECQFTL